MKEAMLSIFEHKYHNYAPVLLYLFVCVILLCPGLFAQTDLEEWLYEDQDSEEITNIAEQLDYFRNHPIELNRISLNDLEGCPFFTIFQIKKITEERKQNGPFRSFNDFKNRIEMDSEELSRIQPFLSITTKKRSKAHFECRWRMSQKRPLAAGFSGKKYTGSAWKNFLRFRFNTGSGFRGGILAEKDPGETDWLDHCTGYSEAVLKKPNIRFLLGQYRVESGCGLVLWGPYGFSRGSDPILALRKNPAGLRGYLYSEENAGLSGCAADLSLSQFTMLLFISKSALDATLDSDGQILSFLSSGLHRTDSEIEKRNSVHEWLGGARLCIKWSGGHAGITGWINRYSNPVKNEASGYTFYGFQGYRNSVTGADLTWYGDMFGLSCEIARSRSGGFAFIGNLFFSKKGDKLVLSYRKYDYDFENPHAGGFCQREVQNENGWYIGYTGKWISSIRLDLYYHVFRYPWMTYLMPVPKWGQGLLCQLDCRLSSRLHCLIRTRFRSADYTDKGLSRNGISINTVRDHIQRQYRAQCMWQPFSGCRIRIRFEANCFQLPYINNMVSAQGHKEWGLLMYQDFRFSPVRSLRIDARWVVFDTESYSTRLYTYETDLPGSTGMSVLYNQGTRGFIMLCWQVFSFMRISIKYASTYHDGVSYWGSGSERISDDVESQCGFELDFKW